MDAMLKKKWLCALRYGNYEQTKGRLRNDDGFCCLGTAKEEKDNLYSYDSCGTGHLPEKLREEIGLSYRVQEIASERNDAGDSFERIADWLEEIDLLEPDLSRGFDEDDYRD